MNEHEIVKEMSFPHFNFHAIGGKWNESVQYTHQSTQQSYFALTSCTQSFKKFRNNQKSVGVGAGRFSVYSVCHGIYVCFNALNCYEKQNHATQVCGRSVFHNVCTDE